jgi:FkbM family methyltransferase
MKENFIKYFASILRSLPHFKGKYRIGKFFQNNLIKNNQWKNPEFFITLKNKSVLFIDARSDTHKVPFWTGMRDENMLSLIKKNIKPDAVVFDVGANIGYYAIPLAQHIKNAGGVVHAFEPVDLNFKSLERGIEKNQLKNIISNKFALGNSIGNIEIIKTESGNSSNAVLSFEDKENDYQGLTKEIIPITTLDQYMIDVNLKRCDFIKIDIEGAEIFFIQGAVQFLEKFKPIIYGEFNSFFMKKFGFTFLDIWEIIEPLGYSVYKEDKRNTGSFKKVEKVTAGLNDLLLLPSTTKNINNWIN